MKRLLLIAALLWPGAAFAQQPDVFTYTATPAHIQSFSSSASSSITSGIVSRMIKVTCTAACYIATNVSGNSAPVTKATGSYLPADLPEYLSVTPGTKVYVIGASAEGFLHVRELSR